MSFNIYQLPFEGIFNTEPAPSHYEQDWSKQAVDFVMPIGIPVCAALDGIVLEVIDGFGKGGPEKVFFDKCNMLIIEHENNEYSCYAHLHKGIIVEEGEQIKTGNIVGYSGISGYNTYPHLHFNVMIKDKNNDWITIPVRFKIGKKIKVLRSPRE